MKRNEALDIGPPPFDLMESPLTGTALIEAGAGTGKTYAITGIVLRLIIEKGIALSRILVVTFTEAATEELKSRIRGRLKEALLALRGRRRGTIFSGGWPKDAAASRRRRRKRRFRPSPTPSGTLMKRPFSPSTGSATGCCGKTPLRAGRSSTPN